MHYCCNCEKNVETYTDDYRLDFEVGNEQHYVIGKRRYCSECKNLVYDSKLDDAILKKSFRKEEELLGIEPEKIIELRKSFGLSQAQFSRIIGCAKKTLISYEKGTSIPNDIYLLTLKMLIENPEILYYYVEAGINRLTTTEADKIYDKLEKRFKLERPRNYSEFNGYSELYVDKITSIISVLASEKILKTKLIKELFYIDFLYFKKTVVSLTGLKYLKYQYGPVPENYEQILQTLCKENVISIDVSYNGNYESHYIKVKKKIENVLAEDELAVVNEVKEFFKDYSVSEIVEYSHKEKAFTETKNNKYIDYSLSFELNDF